jgi:hypothetical protein
VLRIYTVHLGNCEGRPKSIQIGGRRNLGEEPLSWINLQSEEFRNLYFSSNISGINSRRIRWAENVARMKEIRNTYAIFVEMSNKT